MGENTQDVLRSMVAVMNANATITPMPKADMPEERRAVEMSILAGLFVLLSTIIGFIFIAYYIAVFLYAISADLVNAI